MKPKLFLICTTLLLISGGGRAQKIDLGHIQTKTTTLVSHARQKDSQKSLFNFEYGVRGDEPFPSRPSPGGFLRSQSFEELGRQTSDTQSPPSRAADAPTERHERYDISYGGISLNGDDNWLQVANFHRSRSVLKDLGEMSWEKVGTVPVLRTSPQQRTGGLTMSRSAGMMKILPEGIIARAVVGHMYLMHVKEARSDYYVMFRVESLEPKGECRLSWRRVPSPER